MAQILDRLNIRKLSIEERIQLVGEIWDSIADEEGLFELTEAQRKEIERRMQTFDTAVERGITWEEIVERVQAGK